MNIGRIERLSLREVWPREDTGFTPWLAENVDLLGDHIGLSLSVIEREQSAGDFWIDLVAQDETGELYIIENQLGRSDHDHLGKLVTYAALTEARGAIWVVSEARAEHIQAIQRLNSTGVLDCFFVKVEAIRISGSDAAPLFTLIAGPSREALSLKSIKTDQHASDDRYYKFWTELLKTAKTRTNLHANISPGKVNWLGKTADLPRGMAINYNLTRGHGQVHLYLDYKPGGQEYSEAVFREILSSKTEIEENFGEELSWQELPSKRACRISHQIRETVDLDRPETWGPFIDELVSSMIRFNAALERHLAQAARQAEANMIRVQTV